MAGRQTKGEKEREKAAQDRVQAVLGAMLKVRGRLGVWQGLACQVLYVG